MKKKNNKSGAVPHKKILGLESQHYTNALIILVLTIILLCPFMGFFGSIRVVTGSLFILFIPGFLIVKLLLPTGTLDDLETVALSISLSVTAVPLLIFYLSLVGMRITTVNTSIAIFIFCILLLAGIAVKGMKKK